MTHKFHDEIDEKIHRLYKDSILKKYDNNWSKDKLIDSLIQLELQLHQRDKLLEKYKLELTKFKQIIIEKDSEISEKKIIINNLKNQITIVKEEKAASNPNELMIHSKTMLKDKYLNQYNNLQNIRNNELNKEERLNLNTDISRNYDDISFDDKNNSILKIIQEKYRKKNKDDCSQNDQITTSSQNILLLSTNINRLNTEYDNLKYKYNQTVDELIDKTKIIESLYSELSYLKTNPNYETNKLDSSFTNPTFNNSLKEGLLGIKEDLLTFLKSWDIIIDINSISFSENYNNENQTLMILKEVKLLVVNLKRLKIEFKTKIKEFYNNVQILTSNYFTFFQEKVDIMNNKINYAQSRLNYLK